ncbi:MAG: nucleoside hydrolase [Lachnospiraceae bacterium]|nr:nucleoside hydrolase [Lachnospiraceae bacterium]
MREFPYRVAGAKKVRVILDTDCYCEADDQFAVAHALMSPKLDVVGICAEHYADRFGPDSEQQSYDEILHVLRLMGIPSAVSGEEEGAGIPVLHGCREAIPDEHTPRPSEASRFIIREALKDDPRPLFITGQGALSNIASAYLEEPSIADRITLVWIGGGSYPEGESEFNVENDLNAANVILSSKIELWQVPKNLYSRMYVPYSVLYEKVYPCGEIGKYLVENLDRVSGIFYDWIRRPSYTPQAAAAAYPGGEMWIFGDQPAVGLILFDQRYSWHMQRAPRIDGNIRYVPGDDPDRMIRVYDEIDRDFIMDDFYAKLKYCFGTQEKGQEE